MNLGSSSNLPKTKDEAQPSKDWDTRDLKSMSEKKTTVEKLILLLNFNFHGKQFPSMKDKRYILETNKSEFWKLVKIFSHALCPSG